MFKKGQKPLKKGDKVKKAKTPVEQIKENLKENGMEDLLLASDPTAVTKEIDQELQTLENERPSAFQDMLKTHMEAPEGNPMITDSGKTQEQLNLLKQIETDAAKPSQEKLDQVKVTAGVAVTPGKVNYYPPNSVQQKEEPSQAMKNMIYDIMDIKNVTYIDARAEAEDYLKQGLSSQQVRANLMTAKEGVRQADATKKMNSGVQVTKIEMKTKHY